MRERLLKLLACPVCGHELKLDVYGCQGKEIIEGRLHCPCDRNFPIIRGVPRFLSEGLQPQLLKLYPEFFNRTPNLFEIRQKKKKGGASNEIELSMSRFGYEWTHFSDYDCNNFEPFIAPLPSNFFSGKLGLDVGCGAGRHARQVSQKGSEVVGLDLSQAVDAAQRNTIGNERVHIIQADIGNLPLKPGIFDFIYSLGVLHHLAEPERSYQALIPFLRKGGALFLWLYAYSIRKSALEILRFVSQRLSNKNIQRMAYICNLIDYGIFINLFRLLQHSPGLGKWIKPYTPPRIVEYALYGFQVSYTDWFDRLSAPITNYYNENEMKLWLQRSRLCNTKLLLEGDSWWWLYGERQP